MYLSRRYLIPMPIMLSQAPSTSGLYSGSQALTHSSRLSSQRVVELGTDVQITGAVTLCQVAKISIGPVLGIFRSQEDEIEGGA